MCDHEFCEERKVKKLKDRHEVINCRKVTKLAGHKAGARCLEKSAALVEILGPT